MLFKLEDNVPEVYTTLSRDFLLLCRLYDTLVNSNIIAQLKIRKQLNTKTIDDKLITLLARRLGFRNDEYIPTDVLRNILTLFPYVIRNKGNINSIKYAVISVINAYYNVSKVEVANVENGVIKVELTSDETVDLSYLSEVLKYVVPVGSTVEIIRKTTEVEEVVVEQPAIKSTKKKASKSAPIVETVRVNKVKLQTIVRL